jgi:large subunit ribosomal protein L28
MEFRHKVFRRVHKVRKNLYSDILKKRIPTIVSKKADRTIKKMGSFDNYILCTKPKDLDSKYGEYLR